MRLSLATKLITAAIIVFLVTGVLSLSLLGLSSLQLRITPGNPRTEMTGTVAKIIIPIQISNEGFLAIKSLSIQTTALDKNAETLAEGRIGPIDIPSKDMQEVSVSIAFDLKTLKTETLRRLAFNDETFTVNIQGSLSLEPLISLAISAQTLLPWGAPLSDFKVGEPAFTPYNATAILATLPIGFKNNSPYIAVTGQIVTTLYDEADSLQGVGTLNISAPQGNQYQQSLNLPIRLPTDMQSLMSNDTTLKYRAELKAFIGDTEALTLSHPIEVNWGAPFYNLKIGTPTFSQHNSTHVKAESDISFSNHSPYLAVDIEIQEKIFNATSGKLQGVGAMPIKAPQGRSFQGSMTSFIRLETTALSTLLFNDATLQYKVVLSGAFMDFTFSEERLFNYSWGAPILNLRLGKPTFQPFNLTRVKAVVPINFTNNSPFLNLDSNMKAEFYNSTGNLVGSGDPMAVTAPAKTFFQGEITGLIDVSTVGAGTIRLKLVFTTIYGTFTKEVNLVA